MIFIDQRFEWLADKNASLSSPKYTYINISGVCPASAIVSDKRIPPSNMALVKKHIEFNSMFVVFLDELSIAENAIASLREIGARNITALYLGEPVHVNGYVRIGDLVNVPEKDYIVEKCKLNALGINLFECPVNCIDVYLEQMEQYIESKKPAEMYPSYIKYKILDDWRAMVAGMPLIGYERADALYQKYGNVGVIDVLRDLTDTDKNKTGFGKIICDRLREWIDIPDGFNIGLVYKEDE